jgi:tetratricopeptide (TPR) repeat protein
MKMRFILYFFLLFTSLVWAEEPAPNANDIFELANEKYRDGDYAAAVEGYESLVTNFELESSDLYFNIGNCYYKLGKIAPAIYYFEKALLLNPNDEAIQTNLSFAQKRAIDDIKEIPEIGFGQMVFSFTKIASVDTWAWIAVFGGFGFLLSFIVYYFGQTTLLKRSFFIGMFVFLLVLFVAVLAAIIQKEMEAKIRPAIVFAEEVAVKTEPRTNAETAFELHEGTKVFVLETVANWQHIQLTDKTQGWIEKEAIKELK